MTTENPTRTEQQELDHEAGLHKLAPYEYVAAVDNSDCPVCERTYDCGD